MAKRKPAPKSPAKPATKPKSNSQAGNPPDASIDSSMPVTWESSGKGGDNGRDKASITNAENGNTDGVTDSGNVTPTADGDGLLYDRSAVTRKDRGRRWEQVRREARGAGANRADAIARANWVCAHEFPQFAADYPEPPAEPPPLPDEVIEPEPAPVVVEPAQEPATGQVLGLGEIPGDWPELPPNAPLAAEVQWVQASRVDVVELLPGGGARIHLERSDRPAPSKAALSWLETAILFPAKWADIVAKATSTQADEREHTRRERVALEAVGSLLADMVGEPTT